MDSDFSTFIIVTLADIGVCLVLFALVILPRFNRWSATEQSQFEGQPKDYIHDRVFREYAGLYFLTYLAIAFVISQVPGLEGIFVNSVVSLLGENDLATLVLSLGQQLGFALLSPYLIVFVLLVQLAAPIAKADERWRSFLLASARVPRDALNLKQQILQSMRDIPMNHRKLDSVYDTLESRGFAEFWDRVARGVDVQETPLIAGRLLVLNLYLVKVNREFEDHYPGINDLQRIESRLLEIAGVLPAMLDGANLVAIQEYVGELERMQATLAEMLAKNGVKLSPNQQEAHQLLSRYGFVIRFTDRKELDLKLPIALVFMGTFVLTGLSVMLFLLLFDVVGADNRSGGPWFTEQRVMGWSIGGGLSYVLAVGCGFYMNETLRNQFGNRSPATYILAFLTAAAASMAFYALSSVVFKPPHILLAINFGLLAIVVIRSRGRRLMTQQAVQRKATQIALQYALITGVLQVMIRCAFYIYHKEDWTWLELYQRLDLPVFFVFGLVRGGVIAFLVAYVFMDCERVYLQGARRKFPRIKVGNSVHAEIGGQPGEVMVLDLSERGAMLRLEEGRTVQVGESIAMLFSFGRMEGLVMSVRGNRARICFHSKCIADSSIHSYIHEEMGLAV
ncbi:PilZ domain-containing protein [Ketobacter sp.]|uniref:PilZ domain-containing protein n=1 Tax=Ketobacter sp. TaxID=2083498 RepID=UPI0025C6FB26|nr:PilZ domain-containing protein [Ketobacter sp.]